MVEAYDKKVKVIVTIGPATCSEESLRKIKDKGIDFVRVNMSHSSIDYLKNAIALAKKVGIPFVIDTEGSQIRTGDLIASSISLEENQEIKIYEKTIIGDTEKLCLTPGHIVKQLEKGDIIYVDFDTLTLLVTDTSSINEGYIVAKAITAGLVGKNKGVVVDSGSKKKLDLPTLSPKDYQSIQIGLEEGIGYIAASFMRSGAAVDEVRSATQNTMRIISKVECTDALENIDEIIKKSDFLLIDRGDLSKEIPIEKIAFTQKLIIHKAKKMGKGAFVATNLLETMIEKRKPTRAEIHDVISTIVDGAYGLTLAAETAIGKYPMECINMLNKLIHHAKLAMDTHNTSQENQFLENLEKSNYLLDNTISSSLIPPHGGKLVDRMVRKKPSTEELAVLPKITLSAEQQMDVEQIAIGTYSPLEGFMGKAEVESVLDTMRLPNGLVWPLPIVLDVSKEDAQGFEIGSKIALCDEGRKVIAILTLSEKYQIDQEEMAQKMYVTKSDEHPGVRQVKALKPIFLAGKIDLLERSDSPNKEYELTPVQTRRLFEERGWAKVVAFHTRNVIHRSHEYIQLEAMQRENCDGLLVHPIIGKKKGGDFQAKYIIESYEVMKKSFYPQNKVVFSVFSSYSRYAGPREALFTALCRKNFGCSHFIVGRDHTGVGAFYHPKASHNIFNRFPDIGIKAVKFEEVIYEPSEQKHKEEKMEGITQEILRLSGTEARKLFEQGLQPPEWFMRPEISIIIVDAVKKGEDVFVKK